MSSPAQRLLRAVRAAGPSAVAFSGGVDSALVAAAFLRAGIPALAVHVSLPLQPRSEASRVPGVARELGVPFKQRKITLAKLPFLKNNPPDRCYLCKKTILAEICAAAKKAGFDTLCDGTHCGDLNGDRPGLKAVAEFRVRSPLLDARLSKPEILRLARAWKILFSGRVASACLVTRIPAYSPVTRKKLDAIEAAEDALFALGFSNLRVRHHDAIARIELNPRDFRRAVNPATRQAILDALRPLGFRFATLDLAGYKTGNMNDTKGTPP
ncbi:MAG: ATP-dependent sacrificial sulfur transferase LarE [Kiritimatiellaeota bacterium]|nr:ATP-dependent sacrificial sulfur transferase LarE [Kiritimatiellota bacterium]